MASLRVTIGKIVTFLVTALLLYMSVILYMREGILMKIASVLILIYVIARLFAKKRDFQIGILELVILIIFSTYAFKSSVVWMGLLLSTITLYFIYTFQKEYIEWVD